MDEPPIDGSTSPEASRSRYRFVLGGLLILSNVALGLNLFSASPVLQRIIDEYSVSHATAALVVTLALLGSAAFGLPGGVIVSRLGLRNAITLGAGLMALMALTAVVPNIGVLLVLRLAYGLGLALLITATGPILLRWFGPKEVLVMNGINTAAITVGITLSFFTVVPLSNSVGWQTALSIFSIAGVAAAVGWLFLGGPAGSASPAAAMVSRRVLWQVLSNRTVLLLVVADAGVFIQYTALATWLPTFYEEVRNISESHAAFITGLLPFVGIFAVLLGGILPAMLGSKRLFFIIPGTMVVLAGPGSFLLGDLSMIYLSVIILGFGSWMCIPSILSLPMHMRDTSPEKVAIVWGLIVTIPSFGTFVSPLVVGGLKDITDSFNPGFAIAAVAAWAILVAAVLIPKEDMRTERAG